MDQVDVLEKMFEQVRKEHNFPWFYSELKRQNIAYYIYYLATDNIREGANKRGNSSRLTQSFHFFMFEPIFSPVNALNQPI